MTDSDRLVEPALSEGRLFSLAEFASTTGLAIDQAAATLDKLMARGLVRAYSTGLQTLYWGTGSAGQGTRRGAA